MAHEVSTGEVQPQATAATIRVTTAPDEVGRVMGEVLPEVWGYLEERGIHPAGPPFARYHACRESEVDLEAGFPVARPVDGEGRVSAGELPGGEVAATWHAGHYDTLPAAYRAPEAWMEGQGRKPAAAPWEVYWTDPGETPDPARWETGVLWPIGQSTRGEQRQRGEA